MSTWDPNDTPFDPLHDGAAESWRDADATPTMARAVTQQALPLRLERITVDGVPDGDIGFATYLNDLPRDTVATDDDDEDTGPRPIGRNSMPARTVEAMFAADIFCTPAALMLAASAQPDGTLKAHLFALLPPDAAARLAQQLRADQDEPWRATAGASSADEETAAEASLVLVSVVYRLAENRKHPTDLAAETIDLLGTLLMHGGISVDAMRVENALRSL